jgi:hypothetical protein
MSIDVSVHLYFPVPGAAAALEATRRVLRKRKFVLGILVATPDGETIRIPASIAVRDQVEVRGVGGMRLVKVPTISPAFPVVDGPEPVFSLEEETSISGLVAELAFRKGGEIIGSVPVGLSLARGRDYLELSLSSFASGYVQQFFSPRFRSRVTKILEEGGGVAAVYLGMGEWSAFSDQSPIEDTEGKAEAAGIDAFVTHVIEQLGGSN